MKPPVFTAIVDTFNRPQLLRLAVDALRRQTLADLEIVLVDNASTPETKEYLEKARAEDRRIKIVRFEKNQFSFEDPLMMLDTCLNAGLREASGEFVWYQSDDDVVSDNYAEKMAALFRENPDCTTAAGLPVATDAEGRVLDSGPRKTNLRPRYMPGRELALRVARGDHSVFSAPGTIFTLRRETLIKAGGYHRAIEHSQLYGIAPFGVTGFDETAVLYWRRHEGQLNKLLTARGWIGGREIFDLVDRWELRKRWEVFGPAVADEVCSALADQVYRSSGTWFANNIVAGRPIASFRLMRNYGGSAAFWRHARRQFAHLVGRKSARLAERVSGRAANAARPGAPR